MVETTKDLIETIVGEKTKELEDTMDDLLEWKRKMTEKLEIVDQSLIDLKEDVKVVIDSFIKKEEVIDVKTLEPKKKIS
tara:strand:+ start:172 stop:408 length:237 start_codon:yes stop_codon:yes gene_type:complete